jgi:iron-sulfur cluster repair protein YtfE (RIC family)
LLQGWAAGRPAKEGVITMDAIAFLKHEHEKAKDMFQRIEQARDGQRAELWNKLRPELKIHEKMEEAHLYGPVGQDRSTQDATLRDWPQHHHEEVRELEAMIEQLNGLNPSAAQWLEKLRTLKSTLEHHIQEEEQQIWPKIQRVWDRAKLDQAGTQMEAMKKKETGQAA